jgi:hypothetical protein
MNQRRSKMNNRTRHGAVPMPQPRVREVPPGTPIQVDLKNATMQKCECGNTTFTPAVQVYKVSAILSPNGQELIANQQVVICTKCQKLFDGK